MNKLTCWEEAVMDEVLAEFIGRIIDKALRVDLMRVLLFQIDIKCKKITNTVIMLVSVYILCVGIGRQEGY